MPIRLLRSHRVVLAVSAITIALGVAACGSSAPKTKRGTTAKPTRSVNLDTATVALAIANSIKAEKNITASVACPPDIPQKKGLSFTCVATTYTKDHGKKVPVHTDFTVTQQNNLGRVYYSSPQ